MVIHQTIPPGQQVAFGQTLLATVLLMAQSIYVITQTGNMALWTALFRGLTRDSVSWVCRNSFLFARYVLGMAPHRLTFLRCLQQS